MTKFTYTLLTGLVVGATFGFQGASWIDPSRSLSVAAAPVTVNPVQPTWSVSAPPASLKNPDKPSAAVPSEDPATWLGHWLATGSPPNQAEMVLKQVAAWAEKDAAGALDFVFKAPRFPRRLHALAIPLALLGQANPAVAAAWIKRFMHADERSKLASLVARAISKQNLAGACELTLDPELALDGHVANQFIASLAKTDLVRALDGYRRLAEDQQKFVADDIAEAWYERDPAGATSWCLQLGRSPAGLTAMRGLIDVASRKTPEKIPELVVRLGMGPEDFAHWYRDFATADQALTLMPYLTEERLMLAVACIAGEELSRDPALALQLASDVLSPGDGRRAIRDGWREWQRTDPLAARDWAASLADEQLQRSLLGDPAEQLMKSNPRQFLAEAVAAGQDGPKRELMQRALRKLAESDPVEAAQWITRLPREVSQESIGMVAADWLRKDEAAAWQWIASQSDVVLRDAALGRAVQHWSTIESLALASTAIAAVSNPQNQTLLRWQVARELNFEDAVTARQWLATQPLSAEIRENWACLLGFSP